MKGLSKELLATLMQVKGLGTKTILRVAERAYNIETIEELYRLLNTFKERKCQKIKLNELRENYAKAIESIKASEALGIATLGYYDEEFPDKLRSCVNGKGVEEATIILYYRGDLSILDKAAVAVVGTREPTANGLSTGRQLALEFARRGFNIVSGLAIGCDTAAHEGALEAEGATTAVLANGLDWADIYPKENIALAQRIVDRGGLLLSEYPIGQRCERKALIARDRLQAGLGVGTMVIQTSVSGGTMHAVNATIAAKKPVFVAEYSDEADLQHENTQGNLRLLEENKAFPIRVDNLEEALAKLQ